MVVENLSAVSRGLTPLFSVTTGTKPAVTLTNLY